MLSYHPAKFSGHRHCGSGDIIVLVCHVIFARPRDQRVRATHANSPPCQVCWHWAL